MWMRMWSSAVYDLGLTSEEFFALTHRQFDCLIKRHRNKVEHNEFLFGQLTSWIANTGFRATVKPTKHTDFMPSKWGSKEDEQKPVVKNRRRSLIAQEIRGVMAAFGVIGGKRG